MKWRFKHLLCILVLLLGIGISYHHSLEKKYTNAKQDTTANNFLRKLNEEHHEAMKRFETIGITQKKLDDARILYQKAYDQEDRAPSRFKKISSATQQFVRTIINRCGLDPNTITLVPFNDSSPAAATEHIIFINEDSFSQLSDSAKAFVIGHEAQHILNKDDSTFYAIERKFGLSPEKLSDQDKIDHPLCHYSRFVEIRADLETALRGLDMAEGYQEFAELLGNNRGITHPKRSERIKLAKQVFDYSKTQQVA